MKDPSMLKKKKYAELIQPFELRAENVAKFLNEIKPKLSLNVF